MKPWNLAGTGSCRYLPSDRTTITVVVAGLAVPPVSLAGEGGGGLSERLVWVSVTSRGMRGYLTFFFVSAGIEIEREGVRAAIFVVCFEDDMKVRG
ncbi:hypothetical protein Hanom_Chr09g00792651 [Helianthus anomalus]